MELDLDTPINQWISLLTLILVVWYVKLLSAILKYVRYSAPTLENNFLAGQQRREVNNRCVHIMKSCGWVRFKHSLREKLCAVGLLFIAVVVTLSTAAQSVAQVGASSGLPLPRFVSLRAAEVNLRSGPGVRYPILWVFHRKNWPVEIVDEFDNWRQVRDLRGTRGWVHRSMVQGRRFVVVQGAEVQPLRAEENSKSGVVARLEPGVIARLEDEDCAAQKWCPVSVESFTGWLPAAVLYGVRTTNQVK